MSKKNSNSEVKTNRGNGNPNRDSKLRNREVRAVMFDNGKPNGISKKYAKQVVLGIIGFGEAINLTAKESAEQSA